MKNVIAGAVVTAVIAGIVAIIITIYQESSKQQSFVFETMIKEKNNKISELNNEIKRLKMQVLEEQSARKALIDTQKLDQEKFKIQRARIKQISILLNDWTDYFSQKENKNDPRLKSKILHIINDVSDTKKNLDTYLFEWAIKSGARKECAGEPVYRAREIYTYVSTKQSCLGDYSSCLKYLNKKWQESLANHCDIK